MSFLKRLFGKADENEKTTDETTVDETVETNDESTEEEKEPTVGKYKTKRKFLNFVTSLKGRIRIHTETAYISGRVFSGLLEDVVFKITICDDGNINFEEVEGTNIADEDMIKRLIDEIDDMELIPYTHKYVVRGLEFRTSDDKLCYLEIEEKRPIDKLAALFDERDKEEEKVEEISKEISNKGLSALDALFGDTSSNSEEESKDEVIEEAEEEVVVEKPASVSYIEEQFKKMNEEKINELKRRIEDNEKETVKLKRDITLAENRLKKQVEDLSILETRLDSFNVKEDPTGYVFFVSEKQKEDLNMTDENKVFVDKIADLLNLKKDVLYKSLADGFYTIRIAEENDINAETIKVKKEVYNKLLTVKNGDDDPKSSITFNGNGEFTYKGSFTWHQLVDRMIRKGFKQDPEFDKHCGSNSYTKDDDKSKKSSFGFELVEIPMTKKTLTDEEKNERRRKREEERKKNRELFTSKVKTSEELISKELRTFDKPTTLVVAGIGHYDVTPDLFLYDDETFVDYFIGDKMSKESLSSDGFLKIFTLESFENWKKEVADSGENVEDMSGVCDAMIIPNFKGSINITQHFEDYDLYSTDFNENEDTLNYMYYEKEYGYSIANTCLVFPEGTTIIQMDGFEVPEDVLREIKLKKILKD